jgi:1-acyl-sn-glycerol-3-phosphate acyltransferase
MLKLISQIYFWLIGWKAIGKKPDVKKYVLIAAPHTSNLDFPIAVAVWTLLGLRVKYLAKKELFRFPLGIIMEALGGIPVDRSKKGKMVEYATELLNSREELGILIPVEGTRSYSKEWKTGFYYTALGAGVPIAIGFLDFGKKEGGVMEKLFYPTGNLEEDIKALRSFYKGIIPKHPEKSSLNE